MLNKVVSKWGRLAAWIAESNPAMWTGLAIFFCIVITSSRLWLPAFPLWGIWTVAAIAAVGVILSGLFCIARHIDNLGRFELAEWVWLYAQVVVLFGAFYFFIASIEGFETSFYGLDRFEWVRAAGEKSLQSFFDAFVGFTYFSLVTISTLGYGDIYPIATWSRLLVVAEVLVGWYIVLFGIGKALSSPNNGGRTG